jgi:hypothetical protein
MRSALCGFLVKRGAIKMVVKIESQVFTEVKLGFFILVFPLEFFNS